MEVHWKFLGGGGLKSQNYRSKVILNFLAFGVGGGGWLGCKTNKKRTFGGGGGRRVRIFSGTAHSFDDCL